MNTFSQEIVLRPGRPQDCAVASELIYATGAYFFNHVFGRDSATICRLLSRLYSKGSGIFTHRFSTVAEHQGQVVGLALAYDGWQRHCHSFLNDFYVLTRFSPARIVGMLYRDFHVKRFIKRIPHGSYYIAHLAVLPEFQHHGVGHLLLKHFIEHAKTTGYATCSLDASVKNTVAVNLYQEMGFIIARTVTHHKLEVKYHLPAHHRMIRTLTA